jgi:hypothetical protein
MNGQVFLDRNFTYGNPKSGTTQEWQISSGQYIGTYLDQFNNQQPSPIWTIDSPKIVFSYNDPYNVYISEDHFIMYLFYKPNGTDTIWVPLRQISWNWIATAEYNNNLQDFIITSDTSSCDSSDIPVYTLPEWSNITNSLITYAPDGTPTWWQNK